MKYLLADSGSTKTDWIEFWSGGERPPLRTAGTNPDIQRVEDIERSLREGFLENGYAGKPARIFFYGASLSNQANCDRISQVLDHLFPGVPSEVEHDLLAAARATCLHEAGITCILGTGSNSCLYDGSQIVSELGGHGYLFGDEGAGSDLGKTLLRNIFNRDLRPEVRAAVEAWTGLNLYQIRREVHQSDRPNVYLAKFSRFISDHLADFPELNDMVKGRFKAFFELTVLRYPGFEKLPVHFVGSVAAVFSAQLHQAMKECGIQPGRHVPAPAQELVRFHRQALGI
jgi:N-acetylglucosamine kinase-like BadF-type ATPase